jgi:hypothetical protein
LSSDCQALIDHYIDALQANTGFSCSNIRWTHIYIDSIQKNLSLIQDEERHNEIFGTRRNFLNVDFAEAAHAPKVVLDTFYFVKHTGQKVVENVLKLSPRELLAML